MNRRNLKVLFEIFQRDPTKINSVINTLGQTPAIVAASRGDIEMLDLLISFNSRVRLEVGLQDALGRDAIDAAADCGHAKIARRLEALGNLDV